MNTHQQQPRTAIFPAANKNINTHTYIRMPPNELSQSLAMSLPFASAIALARMCIASTAARTVVDEVREVLDLFASECPSRRGTMCMGNASLTNDGIPFGLLGALRRLDELMPRCIHREDIAATVDPFALSCSAADK